MVGTHGRRGLSRALPGSLAETVVRSAPCAVLTVRLRDVEDSPRDGAYAADVERVLIVFGAGGAGCVARYLVGLAVGQRGFPYATLVVNLVGAFLIALVLELALIRKDVPVNLQLALTTGFMGGFTTYSSFNFETTRLMLDGHSLRGIVNVGLTLVGAFAAGLAGLGLARRIAS